MRPFEYVIARSSEQALAALAERGDGFAKGGGVDLLDRLKTGWTGAGALVHIRTVPGWDRIEVGPGGLWLGPTVTLAQLAGDVRVQSAYPALAQAAGSAANPHVRNVATVAGNLCQRPRCWYFRSAEFTCMKKGGATCFAAKGENKYHAIFGGGPSYIVHPSTLATVLVAENAELELARAGGRARTVPIGEFFTLPRVDYERENVLQPGELIVGIRVKAPAPGRKSVFVAAKERNGYDWPLGEVAVVLDMRGDVCTAARVVLGAAAPIPWRAQGAEAALSGRRVDELAARTAGVAAVEGALPLGQNEYKVPLFERLVARAVMAAAGGKA
jgi:xanthine dehydrogenase YagS FAD-binding subunit